jgi:hypothetical protein
MPTPPGVPDDLGAHLFDRAAHGETPPGVPHDIVEQENQQESFSTRPVGVPEDLDLALVPEASVADVDEHAGPVGHGRDVRDPDLRDRDVRDEPDRLDRDVVDRDVRDRDPRGRAADGRPTADGDEARYVRDDRDGSEARRSERPDIGDREIGDRDIVPDDPARHRRPDDDSSTHQ